MPDNCTFIYNKDNNNPPVAEITPANADIIIKVIKMTSVSNIIFDNSICYGIYQPENKPFLISRSDFSHLLGSGVTASFHIDQNSRRAMGSFKGNLNLKLYDLNETHYRFTNEYYSCNISKIKPQNINELIPDLSGGIKLTTDKCNNMKKAIGKVEYVDVLIFNNRINAIIPSNSNMAMSFDPLATAEIMNKTPELVLRSYHFFTIPADEITLVIGCHNDNFWLCSIVTIAEDIVIEQFEPLKLVE